jgi:hypothetical protein
VHRRAWHNGCHPSGLAKSHVHVQGVQRVATLQSVLLLCVLAGVEIPGQGHKLQGDFKGQVTDACMAMAPPIILAGRMLQQQQISNW